MYVFIYIYNRIQEGVSAENSERILHCHICDYKCITKTIIVSPQAVLMCSNRIYIYIYIYICTYDTKHKSAR